MDPNRKRAEASNDDFPIYSRLFVVCGKDFPEKDLVNHFSHFGHIQDTHFPLVHFTKQRKGVAYIKFSKTSEAARALEALHMKVLSGSYKPLKVFVACGKSEIPPDQQDNEKYKRLFMHVAKDMNEETLTEYFSTFGCVESLTIQRDHNTLESKGFAYVTYRFFSEAAKAQEECEKKYRAIFAKPRSEKLKETFYESNINLLASGSIYNSLFSLMDVETQGYTCVNVMCSSFLTRHHIQKLFDIVPGMIDCFYDVDIVQEVGRGTITYSSPVSASYAVEKLHNFEYPPGCRMSVFPRKGRFDNQVQNAMNSVPQSINNLQSAITDIKKSSQPDLAKLAEAIAEASKLIKAATSGITDDDDVPDSDDLNYCSVQLPPPQPLAGIDTPVVKRCFLVCTPQPPPQKVLRDIFCRFGDLLSVYSLPNKTVGYAKYASADAADNAIKTLHGAEICGVRMKVLEAEEENRNPKRQRFS